MQVYDATWVVYKGVLCATIGQQVTAGTVIVKKDASMGGTAENKQMKPEKTSPADQSSRAFQAKLKGKAKVSGNLDERLADAAPARQREQRERERGGDGGHRPPRRTRPRRRASRRAARRRA